MGTGKGSRVSAAAGSGSGAGKAAQPVTPPMVPKSVRPTKPPPAPPIIPAVSESPLKTATAVAAAAEREVRRGSGTSAPPATKTAATHQNKPQTPPPPPAAQRSPQPSARTHDDPNEKAGRDRTGPPTLPTSNAKGPTSPPPLATVKSVPVPPSGNGSPPPASSDEADPYAHLPPGIAASLKRLAGKTSATRPTDAKGQPASAGVGDGAPIKKRENG